LGTMGLDERVDVVLKRDFVLGNRGRRKSKKDYNHG